MKPGLGIPLRTRSRPVCQLCDYILLQQPAPRRFFTASPLKAPALRLQRHGRTLTARTPARTYATATTVMADESQDFGMDSGPLRGDRIAALQKKLADVEQHIRRLTSAPKVEPEGPTIKILDDLEWIAHQAIAIRSRQPEPAKIDIKQSSAGAVLSMGRDDDDNSRPRSRPRPLPRAKKSSINDLPSPSHLSSLALDLLRHPNIFLSPQILALYIRLQRLLARPRAIPEALYLYANKPVPELGSSPPKFSQISPKSAKQAIPANLAEEALTAAIEAKDMPLALDVIQESYCAPAWRRHRILTKLAVPGAAAALTPFALWMIAQELSVFSGFIDPNLFKLYAFMGMSTYVLCTGTLGFVALTTFNDHHTRVVWRTGKPLWDRYLGEDERAALDRVACAWGFKEAWRRGDEEGEEWESLRQWIRLKGMILDKPDLMPGMNASS
jgi:hypothetical protein